MLTKVLTLVLLLVIFENVLAKNNVICYYASWAAKRPGYGKVTPADLDPHLCTHVNYAFLGLDDDGQLLVLDEHVDIELGGLKDLSELKKTNPDLKLLVSLGGYAAGTQVFTAISSDPKKRETMARSAVEFLRTHNFDGLDVDWEYPLAGDRENFITMLNDLKTAFQPYGFLLTVAVAAIPTDAAYDVPAMSRVLDVINLMTYDFHSSWNGLALHHSPLYGSPTEGEWQRDNLNCNSSVTHWILEGADPGKLALGVAFYGHSFVLSDPSKHDPGALTRGPASEGPYTNNSGTLGYNELCEFHKNAQTGWEGSEMVPYLYDGDLWVGFDDPESVALKARYAKTNNLYGVMIWSVETDDVHGVCGSKYGLLQAINEVIRN